MGPKNDAVLHASADAESALGTGSALEVHFAGATVVLRVLRELDWTAARDLDAILEGLTRPVRWSIVIDLTAVASLPHASNRAIGASALSLAEHGQPLTLLRPPSRTLIEALANGGLSIVVELGDRPEWTAQDLRCSGVGPAAAVTLRVEPSTRSIRISVAGEIDRVNAPVLACVADALRRATPKDLVVDMTDVDLLDSGAARALIGLRDDLDRAGQRLHLRHPRRSSTGALDALGLSPCIDTVPHDGSRPLSITE